MTRKVLMLPKPSEAANDNSNSINQIVLRLQKHLPAFGYELTENEDEADLVAAHAGQSGRTDCDVAHAHGLYPTSLPNAANWHWGANRAVVNNLIHAKAITVPSQWVADILRRDMHVDPDVIGWAIEPDEWSPPEQPGDYVLWAKTRTDGVCSPATMLKLAASMPQQRFLATFGDNPTPNVHVVGRQRFEVMQNYVRNAGVYLADTKETFGIMTLEAMACGVPVVGYRWGGTADIVEHGVTGYLVEPGDVDGLRAGVEWCFKHRAVLGANARRVALAYTWDNVARQIAAIYDRVLAPADPNAIKVTVVIPCHNYGEYLAEAVESVFAQKTTFKYDVVVLLDRCSDDSEAVAHALHRKALDLPNCSLTYETVDYGSVARTRNHGIRAAAGEYIVCLDADDRLGTPEFLQALANALDADRSLGVVFTGITTMTVDGTLGSLSRWPDGYDYDQQVAGRNQVPTCCMFRKDAWRRAGGYRPEFQPAEDAALWLRIGAYGYRAKQVTKAGWFHYRLHSRSLSAPVRRGEMAEPKWRAGLPWVDDSLRPFAADGRPVPNQYSWPVRNYDQPVVTFVVPVGPGHARYVQAALDSIEAQTDRRWECVVVNDSGEPLDLSFTPWVRLVETPGGMGAAYARNRGIEAARARLVAFLDADDLLEPAFLARTLRAHSRTGRYVYTDWVSLNKENRFEGHETPEYVPQDVFHKTSLHSINVLIPKRWLLDVGGFDETMRSWEDVDLFMKLAAAGYCGTRVAEPLVIYRYATGSLREYGETIKGELKALLYERYGEYMEDKVACGCKQPVRATHAAPTLADNPTDMIRVEYTWSFAPAGKAPLRGAVTGARYGMRAQGEIFYVWAKDYQAMREYFTPVADLAAEIDPTVEPPAPELIG